MTVAELFVNLGVKGEGPAQKSLVNVRNSLKEISSTAFLAKAGILALLYGTEKLMSASAQAGMGLQQFETLTGLSAESLQRWQFAARQAGVSSEEFTGSLKSVQSAMTNMLLGKGAPEGMAMLASKVGFDPKRARDTFYVMEQLQKFARTSPPDLGNAVLKSFGLGEGTIQAMRRNSFDPKVMARAPIYSENEISKLAKVDVAWDNLGNKIKMALGHLTASHGLGIVKDIAKVADEVMKLISALTTLAEKLKVFKIIGTVFQGLGDLVGVANQAVNTVTTDKGGIWQGLDTLGKNILGNTTEAAQGAYADWKDRVKSSNENREANVRQMLPKSPIIPGLGSGGGKTQNFNIKQDLHFQHEGKDHQRTGDSVHKAIQQALRQTPAQSRAN